MFKYDEELCVYKAEINGIEFMCEELSDEYIEDAKRLAECYEEKIGDIANAMINDITEMYGEMSKDELINSLGKPTVDLDMCMLCYFDHTLDNEHIIEVEFEGDFDELVYMSIDG